MVFRIDADNVFWVAATAVVASAAVLWLMADLLTLPALADWLSTPNFRAGFILGVTVRTLLGYAISRWCWRRAGKIAEKKKDMEISKGP